MGGRQPRVHSNKLCMFYGLVFLDRWRAPERRQAYPIPCVSKDRLPSDLTAGAARRIGNVRLYASVVPALLRWLGRLRPTSLCTPPPALTFAHRCPLRPFFRHFRRGRSAGYPFATPRRSDAKAMKKEKPLARDLGLTGQHRRKVSAYKPLARGSETIFLQSAGCHSDSCDWAVTTCAHETHPLVGVPDQSGGDSISIGVDVILGMLESWR